MPEGPDLAGWKFGKWTVLGFSHDDNRNTYWDVQCACGTKSTVSARLLRSGDSTMCLKCGQKNRGWYGWSPTYR